MPILTGLLGGVLMYIALRLMVWDKPATNWQVFGAGMFLVALKLILWSPE